MVKGGSAEHPRPASPERRHAQGRRSMREPGDEDEGAGEDEGEEVVGARCREGALHEGEEYPARRDHDPERGQGQGRLGGRGTQVGHQFPFIVSQMP